MSISKVLSTSDNILKSEVNASQPSSTASSSGLTADVDYKVKKEMRLLEAVWNASDDHLQYALILEKGIKDVGRKVDALFNATTQDLKLETVLEKIKASIVEDPEFQKEQQTYIPLMGAPARGVSGSYNLLEEIQMFLKGEQRVLLLIGDSGSGKSLFSQILSYHLWQAYQAVTGVIPLYISLPSLKDPVNSLISHAAKQLGLTFEEMREIKNKREVIFILDGYDEIPRNSEIIERNQLLNFKGKIVVTCRTEALPSIDLFVPVVNRKPMSSLLREIYIVPFSLSQIDQFIQKCISLGNTKWKQVSLFREQIERIPGLKELVQNPFILKIIIDTLPEIIDQVKPDKAEQISLTRYALYQAFMQEWFQKGFMRARKHFTELQAVGLEPDNLKKEVIKFCIQLANMFQAKGETHVPYDTEDPDWKPFFKKDLKTATLRSMTPLKVSREGTCYFLHKSLLEYFVALGTKTVMIQPKIPEASTTSTSQGQQIPKPTQGLIKDVPFFDTLLEPPVWLFLADTIKEDPVFKQELFSLIEQSKSDPRMAIAAANAITILNLANVSFSGKDFRGIRIPKANLEKAILAGADLRDADLFHANLSGAVLTNALLDRAQMEGVEFGQLPKIMTKDTVRVLIPSLDGKQIIGGVNSDIIIWDCATGKEIKTLQGYTHWVTTLVPSALSSEIIRRVFAEAVINSFGFSPQMLKGHIDTVTALALLSRRELLASGSDDRTIRIWDLKIGKTIQILRGHSTAVTDLTLLDGELLASGGDTIRIWDLKTGKTIQILQGEIKIMVPLSGGELLAFGSLNGTISILNLKTSKTIQTFQGHMGPIRALAPLFGRKFLGSGSEDDSTIRIWNFQTGETLNTLQGHEKGIMTLIPLFGGELLASGSFDNNIRIWNLNTSETIKILQGHMRLVCALTLLQGRELLVSGSWDNTIRFWTNIKTDKSLKSPQGHTCVVSALTILRGRELLASGGEDKTIRIWDLKTGESLKSLRGHTGSVRTLASLQGGELLASASHDHTIRIWNLKTRENTQTLQGHNGPIFAMIPLRGGEFLASGGFDNTIRIWDLKTGKNIQTFQGPTGGIIALTILQGRELLASGGGDKTIRIWDLKTGEAIQILKGHGGIVTALALLSESEFIASGSDDRTIRIWDLKTSETIQILKGHLKRVTALALLSGNEFLISGSWDRTIRIWNLKIGQEVFKILHPFMIISLEFKEPDLLYAGDSAGGIWCWQLSHDGKIFHSQLLWATNPSLICNNVKIGTTRGLSPTNQRLMLQHGADE